MSYEKSDDFELDLEPLGGSDELELESVADDDALKQVAPDVPFNAGVRLIPVICSACKTRLYAGEDQVGLWKRCPDCDRLTEIRAVAPRFILTADDPEAAGGYNLQNAEVSKNDIKQLRKENQKIIKKDQELKTKLKKEEHIPKTYVEEQPAIEKMLNKLLKSDDEKNDENKIIQREKQINDKIEAIKKAARNGKLDEFLATSDSKPITDPAERKRLEKQRQFNAAISTPPSNLSQKTPPPPPPPLQSSTQSSQPSTPASIQSSFLSSTQSSSKTFSLFSPLADRSCRARLLILTVCGFVGNLTGEKARSMIWQASIDKVYDQIPGYAYNWAESGILFVNFWFGAVLSVVWLCLLFLFGVSIFEATLSGRDRVERWMWFDLDFGFSYIGWSFLILYVSGFPGFVVWFLSGIFLPDYYSQLIFIHFAGQFFCFPILFLCVIESDTFYGKFPRKTLASLRKFVFLWLAFYIKSGLIVGIPALIIFGLAYSGTAFFDNWFVHSLCYYIISAILLTFCGYFVLFYFRLLGKMAHELKLNE
ncbi:MAG: hypothetical protein LBP59_12255 [Planctomycetaceae bacterium]|jgi:hypothetical protein|nr:hypothetical protein [Planctomycetaceae bacterium]